MSRISDRFDAAASTYAQATPVQRQVATALAASIVGSGMPPIPLVAEFGCGVGYLHRAYAEWDEPGLWVATDLAPAMARASATNLPAHGVVAVMDAARPALKSGFDLVCSSLTLQWLEDGAAAVAEWRNLVRPGGTLGVATLTEGSFKEWRAALGEAGAPSPSPIFPTLQVVRDWFGPTTVAETMTLTDSYPSALAFARASKAAGIDASLNRTLGAGQMKQALRAFEASGSSISYEVALILERKDS